MRYLDLVPTLLIPELTKVSTLSANLVNAQGGKWGEAGAGTGINLPVEHDWNLEVVLGVVIFALVTQAIVRLNDPYRLGRRR